MYHTKLQQNTNFFLNIQKNFRKPGKLLEFHGEEFKVDISHIDRLWVVISKKKNIMQTLTTLQSLDTYFTDFGLNGWSPQIQSSLSIHKDMVKKRDYDCKFQKWTLGA